MKFITPTPWIPIDLFLANTKPEGWPDMADLPRPWRHSLKKVIATKSEDRDRKLSREMGAA